MASSAAEPPPPPPPPPGGGEGSASTRSRSTPVAEFVCPSGVPTLPASRGEDWESEGSNAWIPSGGRASSLSGAGASSGGRASCLSTAAASANSVHRGAPCRSTAAPSVPSASGSQIVRTVDVEDDADIEDQSPQDDEDELIFDDTDDEEKNENDDNLVLADYEGEDLPTIEWNREDPQLAEGTVFQTMMDCRNAITTYHILSKNNYEVIKSEPDKEE
ncbi:hypothetical protein QYE76_023740 [Lolium multiflorum]|uniref:Uncharacterized protein n=1 Tax=Lolium multiflorum TaxID=4521 RepID=A0AAD8RFB8_LOLMU|nr:hypothetical protein QYE76_023740 [Lolium multiflorum]